MLSEKTIQKMEQVAKDAGFILSDISAHKKKISFAYRRASGPTVWDLVSPDYVSKKGRLDFTTCHTACADVELADKKALKAALRQAVPECHGCSEIFARYADHHDKLREIPNSPGHMTFNNQGRYREVVGN